MSRSDLNAFIKTNSCKENTVVEKTSSKQAVDSLTNIPSTKKVSVLKENKSFLNTDRKFVLFQTKTDGESSGSPIKIKPISGAKLDILKQQLKMKKSDPTVQIDLTSKSSSDYSD